MAQVARGKALVAKLRAQAGVRDPEALAAYLGRFKKARKAGKSPAEAAKAARGEDSNVSKSTTDSDGISNAARQEIEKREDGIRNLSFEKSILVDNEGNHISTASGGESHVMNSPSDLLKIKDGKGISTHNHPGRRGTIGETSFSEGDFSHFLQWRPAEFRAVTPNYTFRLRGPQGGWGERPKPKFGSRQVADDFQAMRNIVEIKAKKWREEGISSQEMDFRKTNEIARLFAKAYGLRYDVEEG